MVRERDLVVLSDEVYSRIVYGDPPVSIAILPGVLEKTITLEPSLTGGFCACGLCKSAFSKRYAVFGSEYDRSDLGKYI